MRHFTASLSRVKKQATIISRERKIPLFEAQDIVSMEVTGKNFHELNLHANGEKRRDMEDRKELFQEVVAYLKQEFDQQWSEEGGSEPVAYQLGSPISKLEDSEKYSISAYDSRGFREFSVHIFPSRPSDEWLPDISKDQFDMLQAHQKKSHDLGLFVGIIPSYRHFAMGKPIWQWMIQAAIAHAKNHFSKQMDVVNVCGRLYAQGITDVFDSPKDTEFAITERGLVVGSNHRFIGTVPQIIDRRSEGHGYFREAMAWAEDDQGRIFTSHVRMLDDMGTFPEMLDAVALIRLRKARERGEFISPEQFNKKLAS